MCVVFTYLASHLFCCKLLRMSVECLGTWPEKILCRSGLPGESISISILGSSSSGWIIDEAPLLSKIDVALSNKELTALLNELLLSHSLIIYDRTANNRFKY